MDLSDFCLEWAGSNRRLAIYKELVHGPYQESEVMRYPEQRLRMLIEQNTPGLYVSVNPYNPETMEISSIERLYFDFDCKEKVRYALDDCIEFCKKLVGHYNISPLIFFSGSKGYAVYVFLQEPILGSESELKELYQKLQDILVGSDKYRWLDPAPLGDLKRVSRVPFSLHQKTSSLCVPVDISEYPPTPYKLDPGFIQYHKDYGLNNKLVEFAKRKIEQERTKPKRYRQTLDSVQKNVRPCLANIMESTAFPKPKKGYDGHNLMISAVIEYICAGYSKDEILGLLSKKQGYNEVQSQKFVNYISSKYHPRRCETIAAYGGCVSNDCPNAKKGRIEND